MILDEIVSKRKLDYIKKEKELPLEKLKKKIVIIHL